MDYTPNWSEEVFVIKKVIQYHGHTLLVISTGKKSLKPLMKKSSKRQAENHKDFKS